MEKQGEEDDEDEHNEEELNKTGFGVIKALGLLEPNSLDTLNLPDSTKLCTGMELHITLPK